jgi:hypothetical protein
VKTYTEARPLVHDPDYEARRKKTLEELRVALSSGSIDEPIADIIDRFARISWCYTLQSCCGHFASDTCVGGDNTVHLADLKDTDTVLHYRIAYMAFCIQNIAPGRTLLAELKGVAEIDPGYVQFGSADWFWGMCPNSYVLQVSPLRCAHQDSFDVSIEEALHIQKAGERFFDKLRDLLQDNENREGDLDR